LDKVGLYIGDKLGAVRGQVQTKDMWLKGFGRRKRIVAKQRAKWGYWGRITGVVVLVGYKVVAFVVGWLKG